MLDLPHSTQLNLHCIIGFQFVLRVPIHWTQMVAVGFTPQYTTQSSPHHWLSVCTASTQTLDPDGGCWIYPIVYNFTVHTTSTQTRHLDSECWIYPTIHNLMLNARTTLQGREGSNCTYNQGQGATTTHARNMYMMRNIIDSKYVHGANELKKMYNKMVANSIYCVN